MGHCDLVSIVKNKACTRFMVASTLWLALGLPRQALNGLSRTLYQ